MDGPRSWLWGGHRELGFGHVKFEMPIQCQVRRDQELKWGLPHAMAFKQEVA